MPTDYYQILKSSDTIQRGDEFFNPATREWEPLPADVHGWKAEIGAASIRRKLDTEGVDPAHTAGLWRSLHTLLHLFTAFVDEHSLDPDVLKVTTDHKDGTQTETTLFETFVRFAGILKGTNPEGWERDN